MSHSTLNVASGHRPTLDAPRGLSLRGVTAGVFVACAALSPFWADVALDGARFGAGVVLATLAGALFLCAASLTAWRATALVGAVALAAAPAVAWPLFFLCSARREPWFPHRHTLLLLAIGGLLGVLSGGTPDDFVAWREGAADKQCETLRAAAAAWEAALLPWTATFAGPNRYGYQHWWEPLVGGLAATALLWGALFGVHDRRRRALLGWAAAVAAPLLPAALGRPPHASFLPAALAVAVGFAGLFAHVVRRGRLLPLLLTTAALIAWLVATYPTTVARWHTTADPFALYAARAAETAFAPYGPEHAAFLRQRGDAAGAAAVEARYFAQRDASPSARAERLLRHLQAGDDAAAHTAWKRLPSAARPTDRAAQVQILELLARVDDDEDYFALGAELAAVHPELHLQLWGRAVARSRPNDAARHLAGALALPRPPLAACEHRYRELRNAQDRGGLTELGQRLIALYPEAWVGHACMAKAAKLIRDDEAMIPAAEAALARNPDLVDLHYDLGLVFHGRPAATAKAAAHYRQVLALDPRHPRRTMLEAWISALDPAVKEDAR
jgi:tetratricopeptide (TPR) repeat protein